MGKRSYLHRREDAAEAERQAADVEAPPESEDAPPSMLGELNRVPLYTYVSGQPGPQGVKANELWVSVQMNHGLMAVAFALHPAMVDAWVRDTGRDMKAMAAKLLRHNSGLAVVESGTTMPKRELWVPGRR